MVPKMARPMEEPDGEDWVHRHMYGDDQDSEVCEMAMRSGIEARWLKPVNVDEVEMIANAGMIRERLRKNCGVVLLFDSANTEC